MQQLTPARLRAQQRQPAAASRTQARNASAKARDFRPRRLSVIPGIRRTGGSRQCPCLPPAPALPNPGRLKRRSPAILTPLNRAPTTGGEPGWGGGTARHSTRRGEPNRAIPPVPIPCLAQPRPARPSPGAPQALPGRAPRIPRSAPSSSSSHPPPDSAPPSPAAAGRLPAARPRPPPGAAQGTAGPGRAGPGSRPRLAPSRAEPRAHQDEGAAHRLRDALPQLGGRARLAEPLRELPHFRHGDMVRAERCGAAPNRRLLPPSLPAGGRAGAAGRGRERGGPLLGPPRHGPALSPLQVPPRGRLLPPSISAHPSCSGRQSPDRARRRGGAPRPQHGRGGCSPRRGSREAAAVRSAAGAGAHGKGSQALGEVSGHLSQREPEAARFIGGSGGLHAALPKVRPGCTSRAPVRPSWIQDKILLLSSSRLQGLL